MEEKQLEKLNDLFTRGVGEFIDPSNSFREKLEKKIKGEYDKDLIIKFGVDPTRPDIHLGHAVVLRKLRQFQELGCKVVFLVGDFTTTIGDPTGKSKIRPEIDQKEIEQNMKTYLDQIGNLLLTDKEHFSWIRNSDWFYGVTDLMALKPVGLKIKNKEGKELNIPLPKNSFLEKAVLYHGTRMQVTHLKMEKIEGVTLKTLMWGLRHITHGNLISRDMFQDRIEKGEELFMSEMLYPVFQAIDSVILYKIYGSCDLEIGGTDQTFNMTLGRDIMKANKQEQQSVMTIELLEGINGKDKMSKSLDNYIGITDEASNMFGKVMSIPDNLIVRYFELCTYKSLEDIGRIKKDLEDSKNNPRDFKLKLAHEIVSIYHGEEFAVSAQVSFLGTFQKKQIPNEIKEIKGKKGKKIIDIVTEVGLVGSKSDFRRLQRDHAIKILEDAPSNVVLKKETILNDVNMVLEKDIILKLGKIRFVKLIVEN